MDEKRLEILERATSVYMKFGVKSVTMDDLARELGISKKTIYKYFDDKSDLIRTIVSMKTQMDKALCVNCTEQGENAIDQLLGISKLIVAHVGNVNPSVFFDLKKYHQDAWQIMEDHRWGFVLNTIVSNVETGIKQNLYRSNINPEIVGRMYVASIDNIFNPDIFPWPQFTFQAIYTEMIRFHIKGLVNADGLNYLTQKTENGEF